MEFYGDVEEVIPPNMPPPFGKDVDLRMMVDNLMLPYWVYHFLQFSPNCLAIKAAVNH